MESDWRFNVWEQGMSFYYAGFSYYPIRLLARSLDNPFVWIGEAINPGDNVPTFMVPFGGSQLEYSGSLSRLAPNFPYGYDVEPDRP